MSKALRKRCCSLCVALVCLHGLLRAQEPSPGSSDQRAQASSQPSGPPPVRVPGNITPGLLIKKVDPKYPRDARRKHIQGTVVFHAEIGVDGSIHNLTLISGEPSLAKAATKAVERWR